MQKTNQRISNRSIPNSESNRLKYNNPNQTYRYQNQHFKSAYLDRGVIPQNNPKLSSISRQSHQTSQFLKIQPTPINHSDQTQVLHEKVNANRTVTDTYDLNQQTIASLASQCKNKGRIKNKTSLNSYSERSIMLNQSNTNRMKTKRIISQNQRKIASRHGQSKQLSDMFTKGQQKHLHTNKKEKSINDLSNIERLKKQAQMMDKSNIIFGNNINTDSLQHKMACKKRRRNQKIKSSYQKRNMMYKTTGNHTETSMELYLNKEKQKQIQGDTLQEGHHVFQDHKSELSGEGQENGRTCECQDCLKDRYLYSPYEYAKIASQQTYLVSKTFKNTATKKFSMIDKSRNNIKRINQNKSKIGFNLNLNQNIINKNRHEGDGDCLIQQPETVKKNINNITINQFMSTMEENKNLMMNEAMHNEEKRREFKTEGNEQIDRKTSKQTTRDSLLKKKALQVANIAKKFYQQSHHINITNAIRQCHCSSLSSAFKQKSLREHRFSENCNSKNGHKIMPKNNRNILLDSNLTIKGIQLQGKKNSERIQKQRVLYSNKDLLNNQNIPKIDLDCQKQENPSSKEQQRKTSVNNSGKQPHKKQKKSILIISM